VFTAVAVRSCGRDAPAWNGLAIAGLVCVLLYILSQWREVPGVLGPAGAL